MRRLRVSCFLADVTQQIHSFRASGVMAAQRLLAAASDSMALRRSGGSLCIALTASRPLGICAPYLPTRAISIIHIVVQLRRPSLETAKLQLTESGEAFENVIRPTRAPCGVLHSL
jgi:hypothetical protein